MKERFNKIIHSRLFIIVLMGILMCTTMLVGTYAWLTWSSTDNTKLVMSIGRLADVIFSSGNDINGELTPVYNYKDGLSTNFTINNRESVISYVVNFNINTINSNLISQDVKWAIEKNGKLVNEGDLSKASNGVSIDIYDGVVLTEQISYTFYLYIDGNVENNPNMINKTITGSIMVEASEFDSFNLSNYITHLYSHNMPGLITHSKTDGTSDTYYYSYQDGTETWGLMNDGLKVDNTLDATTTGLATTVTELTALTSGTEGNIRYFGPSDKVNNYIYFNCSDYSNQTDSTCEKWRIIGIVDGKVKLIRDESIGDYSWDNKDMTTGAATDSGRNDWSDARLMRLLNPGYENYVDKDNSGNDLIANNSIYWNSGSGTCYAGKHNETKTCDFTNTGLKNDITRNMISESSWYLGGYSTAEGVYPNDIYKYERTNKIGTTIYSGNPYTINANIGLINASDYGYGTDLTKCNRHLGDYNDSENSYACRENNWLFNSAYQWLITPRASDSYSAWFVSITGFVYGYNNGAHVSYYGVRPVLYLEENLTINKGNGTSDSPYQIYIPSEESTTLIEFIKNQYTSHIPKLITQETSGDSYYYSYQDDTNTWGLMNDRLKVDNTLDATTTGLATTVTNINAFTGTEGNIRYFGPSDKVNNYIYFNCETYPSTNCELWRIIGIVDGKVKLIRNDSIGDFSWDNKTIITGALDDLNGRNDWSNARLMRLLNPGYENYIDKDNSGNDLIANNSLYWNSGSGVCYYGSNNSTKGCNFTSAGLKNDTTRNMISKSTWYLGSYFMSSIYPNDIYSYERTNKTGTTISSGNPYTINANIGLMYSSDYGYGTDLTKCSQNLINYNSNTYSYTCRQNNWLFNSSYQGLITPSAPGTTGGVWRISASGNVDFSIKANVPSSVRPVLYLNSELVIEAGHEGTSADPYRIIAR